MSYDNKTVVKEQKAKPLKITSYQAFQTAAQTELTKEKQDLESSKMDLGYGNISWQEIMIIDITELNQALGISVDALQKAYQEYLIRKKQFDNTIYIEPAKLHEVIDAAEKLLLNQSDHIYQRSGVLVCVTNVENSTKSHKPLVNRSLDSMIIKEIDQAYLTVKLTEFGNFISLDSRSGFKRTDCPEKIARYLLSKHKFNVPTLTGIINAPTLRKDGSILDKAGYDCISGLLFCPNNCEFKKIPENPTLQDAINARNALLEIIKHFPFEDEASKSVALAAILTALIRKSISTAPLFGFTAPKMASGKSLLADVVALIGTGKSNSVIAQAENEAEEKKRIMAVLSEGDAIVCYDNIEKPFKSAALCSILTQETYKDRLLGGNQTRTVLTNATFLVTGNNLVFMGDISTRSLLCKLDPQVERPEEREFDLNLREYIPQHRGRLVTAALTILRAYHIAGRPIQNIKPFGRFEDWSNLIRSAIVWIGMTDPCESRKEIEEADPVRQQLSEFFTAWHILFDDRPITVRELISQSISTPEEPETRIEACYILQEIIAEFAQDAKSSINQRRLAKQLSRYKNRIEGGFRLKQSGTRQKTTLWYVEKIKS